ncbi:SIS domain-containing protein [Arthrobacter humicola]|uniref:SIS domain-containing protein n=1 Tax=Arthrobacter humicola TaxID=409291 RepID=UPI001FAB8532|nr:SIS domain-containing protein [Arthrobacter humicola]MCI9870493.1 SIS domain-containing protein [Arthrobacter humicola]
MTDGIYVGTREATPIPQDLIPSQEKALALADRIGEAIAGLPMAPKRIFLVGSGGSYVGLVPLQYLLDTESSTPTLRINSDEFFYRKPASVGSDTLLIALSGTGNTAETVRAAQWAVEQGATVLAFTLKPESLLGTKFDNVFVPEPEDNGQRSQLGGLAASQLMLQFAGLALLRRDGIDTSARESVLLQVPEKILAALEEFEPKAELIAGAIKEAPMTYVLASGPLYGAALTFTMCFMQEMQWMHAATVNSNEFFQGPFEVVDKNSKIVVFLGEDKTRPMGERVRTFLDTYAGEVHYVDAEDFTLSGIPAELRAFVSPIVYHALTTRIAAHLSAATGYELDGRRYMWQVEY